MNNTKHAKTSLLRQHGCFLRGRRYGRMETWGGSSPPSPTKGEPQRWQKNSAGRVLIDAIVQRLRIIYFILGLGFLFLFWMLLSSFGAVYPNTQMFIFKNALISFAMALVYPFFIYIFPCVLRMCSLNSSKKDNECVYKISKFLQMF